GAILFDLLQLVLDAVRDELLDAAVAHLGGGAFGTLEQGRVDLHLLHRLSPFTITPGERRDVSPPVGFCRRTDFKSVSCSSNDENGGMKNRPYEASRRPARLLVTKRCPCRSSSPASPGRTPPGSTAPDPPATDSRRGTACCTTARRAPPARQHSGRHSRPS